MSEISIELVPRSADSIRTELELIRAQLSGVHTVNIPDLLRMDLRSWEACALARTQMGRAIPHLRSMDFPEEGPLALTGFLREHGLDEVLVISGDPPQDMAHRVYPTSPTDLIAKLGRELPDVKVFAGFDPYRSGTRRELDYVKSKLDAGACGFFSQPFFDLRLMDVWADLMTGCEIYWGISPVVSARQRRWWETKNQAFFPAGFEPSLKWNRRFAREALEWARARGTHLYFMPIQTGLLDYLGGVLE